MTEPYLPAVMTPGIIDISHWQPAHDFRGAAGAGIVAIIAKATQGAGTVDPAWTAHAAAARTAGLLLGAYEFLDGSDPVAQADKLIATVNDPTIPLFLDAERNSGSQASVAIVAAVAQRVHDRLGYWPRVYMGRSGPDGTGAGLPDMTLMQCDLWLPEYGTAPICPAGWTAWKLWQYTDGSGAIPVPGVGTCDHSKFAGALDELRAWWPPNGLAAYAPANQPQSAPPPVVAPTIPAVRDLQAALNASGAALDVDGVWGPLSQAALAAFYARG